MKEVALRVEKKVENEVVMSIGLGVRHEKFMACISSQEKAPGVLYGKQPVWLPGTTPRL